MLFRIPYSVFKQSRTEKEFCWPWDISVEHTGCTCRPRTKIWVRSQKTMQTEDRCWKDVVLSDSEELCPQVVERETYEEKSAESAGFLVSRWKKERYFVLCGKDKNIQSPATSHQSPVHVFLGKKMSRKGNSLPFRKIHSSLVIWFEYEVSPPSQKLHVLKCCLLKGNWRISLVNMYVD